MIEIRKDVIRLTMSYIWATAYRWEIYSYMLMQIMYGTYIEIFILIHSTSAGVLESKI